MPVNPVEAVVMSVEVGDEKVIVECQAPTISYTLGLRPESALVPLLTEGSVVRFSIDVLSTAAVPAPVAEPSDVPETEPEAPTEADVPVETPEVIETPVNAPVSDPAAEPVEAPVEAPVEVPAATETPTDPAAQ